VQYRNSLTLRYILVTGFFLVLVELLFGTYQVWGNYQQQQINLEKRALAQANFLSAVTPEWVFSNDFLSLETLMRQTSQEPDIVYSAIQHNDGRFLTRYLNREDPLINLAIASLSSPQLENILTEIRKNPQIHELRTPIISEGVQLGDVWIGYSTASIESNLFDSAMRTLLGSIIVTAVLGILTVWQFRSLIYIPLHEVTEQANALGDGDLSRRAIVTGNNEINRLKTTFNRMADQLQQASTTLQQQEAEARKLSNVASRTDNMVVITDPTGTIEWTNKAFARITEYTLEEVIGQRPGQILQGPNTDPKTIEFMRQKLDAREGFTTEVINYSKNGRQYWVEIEVQTVHDNDNNLVNFIAIESDITARKEAEEQLKHYAQTLENQNQQLTRLAEERSQHLREIAVSEARYRDLFENAHDLIQSVDKNGRFLYVNQRWLNVLGYAVEEISALNIHDILRHDQIRICESVFAQCLRGQDVTNTQFVYHTKQGQEVIIEGNITAQVKDGEFIATRGIFHEVTERVHMDAILRANEARMRAILESAMDCMISIDETGRIIEFNVAAEKTFGHLYNDVIGTYLTDLIVPPRLRQTHAEGMQRYLTTRQPKIIGQRVELPAIHADGHEFPIEISIAPIELDDEIIFTAFLRDISEQKQAAEALRQSELRYRGVVDNQTEMVCRYRPDLTLTFVNNAYCNFFQKSHDALIAHSFLNLLPPDQHDDARKHVDVLMRTRKAITREHRVLASTGKWHWQQWTDLAIMDPAGNVVELQGVGRDITPIKQAQIELQHALVKEKELNELKSRFVSMASHEFRTPLTTIVSTTSFLEMAQSRISPEKQLKRLQKIQSAAHSMTKLIDEVLTYGRAEADRLEFHPEWVNLHIFCIQLVEDIQAITLKHKIQYQNNCPDVVMQLDEKLMRHILTNLLSNALKYSPDGDVVEFIIDCNANNIVMKVIDDGVGIPEADQEQLFQPFHRAKNTQHIAGTGLGLAITLKAVVAHGGNITYKSEINCGTTFTVVLPIEHH